MRKLKINTFLVTLLCFLCFSNVAPALETRGYPTNLSATSLTLSSVSAGLLIQPSSGSVTSIANVAAGQVLTSGTPAAWSTTPTITSLTNPLLVGGTGIASTLTLRSTSGIGAAGADIIFQTGNNGATEAMRILNSSNVGIGTTGPKGELQIGDTITLQSPGSGTSEILNFARNLYTDDGGVTYKRIVADNDIGLLHVAASGDFIYYGNSDTNATADSVVTLAERVRFTKTGNVGIGTATFGTSAVGVLAQGIGTAPTTSPADVVQEWVADCAGAGTACKNWRDEGGNVFSLGNNRILAPSAGDHGWSSRTLLRASADGAFSINTNAGTARFQTTSGAATVGTQVRTAQATVPTCTTNCGTTPSIAGSDTSMIVTLGTGSPASPVTVTFNGTYNTVPPCHATNRTTAANSITRVDTTTTTAVIYFAAGPTASDVVSLTCIGNS